MGKQRYRLKSAFCEKKTCGNCLYLASNDEVRGSNCVIEYIRDNIIKDVYPIVTVATKACSQWEYYGEGV